MLIAIGFSIFFIMYGLLNIIYKPYYNTEDTIDLKKVAIYQGIVLLSIGIALYPVYAIFRKLEFAKFFPFFLFVVLLLIAFLLNRLPKWFRVGNPHEITYDREDYLKRTKASKKYIIALVVTVIFFTLIVAIKMPDKTFTNNQLNISGMYGLSKNIDEIIVIDTVRALPKTKQIIDGVKLHHTLKGSFTNKNNETIRIFANNNFPPFIYIEYKRANKLYFNFNDPAITREVYRKIRIAKDKGVMP